MMAAYMIAFAALAFATGAAIRVRDMEDDDGKDDRA